MDTSNRTRSLGDQKPEIWRRWRAGESLSYIGRQTGNNPATIFDVLRANGGITPRERRRSGQTLSLNEREEISRGIAEGLSMRQIAFNLDRAPSTVCREINRHGGLNNYRAVIADKSAWERAKRPKPCRLAQLPRLRNIVAQKLAIEWSPEQIAGWLKEKYPDNERMHVSHETIYRSLYIQSRGLLKKALQKHLRKGRKFRHSKYKKFNGLTRESIIDAVSIRARPPEVEDRAVPGHWEGDLIAGSNHTYIATLVERRSRFTMLIKVKGKETETVVNALASHIKKLPEELRLSLTWDRGSELAGHKAFTVATDVEVYFCDPSSPWQRGTNENTNQLIRQYFPKGTDLSAHSQAKLNAVARRLNKRPRKTLGFKTPADKLAECVASTD